MPKLKCKNNEEAYIWSSYRLSCDLSFNFIFSSLCSSFFKFLVNTSPLCVFFWVLIYIIVIIIPLCCSVLSRTARHGPPFVFLPFPVHTHTRTLTATAQAEKMVSFSSLF